MYEKELSSCAAFAHAPPVGEKPPAAQALPPHRLPPQAQKTKCAHRKGEQRSTTVDAQRQQRVLIAAMSI
jgi:hypothetical protein